MTQLTAQTQDKLQTDEQQPAPVKARRWRITLNAPVVLGFVGLCLAALIAGELSNGALTRSFFMTYHSSLLSPLTYLRMFSHVLGHSGWEHFVGNMAYILLLGPLLEEKYGSKSLLVVMLITALVTGLVNYVFFWNQALCGASGICFAFILLSSVTSFKEGEIPLTFLLVAIIFLGQQIVQGVFVQDNVSNLSHIIGGIVGAVAGFFLGRNKA
ncbi:MAG: rhomboid family intramembrane serine protease [Atopobiaceae bacterium]|nr:rhomboid family intramembrane serine protease [Atopobiaceae bacterium]